MSGQQNLLITDYCGKYIEIYNTSNNSLTGFLDKRFPNFVFLNKGKMTHIERRSPSVTQN